MKTQKIYNDSERKFAENYFNHNDWEYQHKTYHFSNGEKYRPDFKDKKRNVLIEVVGTRQAFHANKRKYAKFINEFPNKTLEIRSPNGEIIKHYTKIVSKIKDYSWPKQAKRKIKYDNKSENQTEIQKSIIKMLKRKSFYSTADMYKSVAEKLGITSRWVRYLEAGEKKPSIHLAKLIQIMAQ